MGIKLYDINIVGNDDNTFIESNLDDFLNSFVEESTFTDDTVLTIAVADAILNNKDFGKTIWEYGNKYIDRGYGRFIEWLKTDGSTERQKVEKKFL